MEKVIELAKENIDNGGWPFAAVIVKDDKIIAQAVNSTHVTFDPSDHAEIAAIRKATSLLKTTDLSDCTMYVVGKPCPMCATCIVFSKLKDVKYAVGVIEKDEALSNLAKTDGLYNLISENYGS